MSTLKNMENMFGKVSESVKKRVVNYLNNPTYDNWDDIHSLIVNSKFESVWQCVLKIKPDFPKTGRSYDENDNVVGEWSEIPAPLEVMRAIKESN